MVIISLLIRLRRLSCLLVLLVALTPAWSKPKPKPQADLTVRPLPADRTTIVSLRRPAEQQLREFRAQREFQYVEVKSEHSAWDLFWARVWQWFSSLLATRGGRIMWEYGIYALLLIGFVFVVLKLMQVDITRAFGRAPRRSSLAYDTTTEDIHTLDFSALLAEAEATGNYRLAVRLGYLQVLKQLTDQGLIQWQPEKTNHDYVHELGASSLRPPFRELTQQFEYVWYGEQNDLSAAQYALARDARVAFQRQLASTRHAA
ncbi:DUF4129 domain-containing protein [Hymenobacter metallicola]|uniref:DUF4129 domain-containing protein n=1 Tax=Hymenobacter metallicola TaxID=2563114 RepID=A0A4Z0Q2T5_9BACT|nr:DUF4129 domain-containing protein [Hymenobacter metallicola]